MLLEVSEETPIGFLAPDPKRSADVLQKVHMAYLGDTTGVDILRSHANSIVLVTGDAAEWIVRVLEFREELHHCLEILRGSEQADGNVMRDVIHAVDEGNLLVVAFHRHILSIDNQRATESLPVAVPGRDVIVVRKRFQFSYELPVGATDAFLLTMGQRTDARALEMQREDWLRWTTVIDAEVAGAVVAVVTVDTSPRTFLPCSQTCTKVTSEMAS